MKFRIIRPHASIRALPVESLPNFTLLTGLNGSGKTHFLQALKNGNIETSSDDGKILGEISLYDWTTFVPKTGGTATAAQIHQEATRVSTQIQKAREAGLENLRRELENADLAIPLLSFSIKQETDPRLAHVPEQRRARAIQFIRTHRATATKKIQEIEGADNLIFQNNIKFEDLVEADSGLQPGEVITARQIDLFKQSFGSLFLAYYELQKQNHLTSFYASHTANHRPTPLSDDEFARTYGPPPWEFLNRMLEEAGLEFKIDRPEGPASFHYRPQLTKTDSGAPVRFEDLSSGEKVVMSLALCLYNSQQADAKLTKPDVLLFDEIDAPLHPSMARTMVRITRDVLAGELGIPVIITTHSPTTIACADERTVFIATGHPMAIRPTSKRQAISNLLTEVPTLSLDFSGRRQVLVESENDARYLDSLYRWISPEIENERSLQFIPVGLRTNKGDVASGCSVVQSMVKKFEDAGNETIVGLIDWDATNTASDRVLVLCEGERYSLENVLCDPLIVLALLLRSDSKSAETLGLERNTKSSSLVSIDRERLQAAVEGIQATILGNQGTAKEARSRRVSYCRGRLQLVLAQEYLSMNGHILYDRVVEAFPKLKKFHQESLFYREVTENLLRDLPELVPDSFRSTMEALLNADLVKV